MGDLCPQLSCVNGVLAGSMCIARRSPLNVSLNLFNPHPNSLFHAGVRHFGPPPPWFDANALPKLSETQIAWWDECHIEQQGGKVGNRAYQYTFKRDENNNLSSTGTYAEPKLTSTSFKFPEQGRFSFGVASVLPLGATEPVGKRIEHIDYTGKNIVTREVYVKHINEECKRVRALKGKCLPWYVNTRPPNQHWMNDSVKLLKGAGGTKGDKLISSGILTVANMKEHDDNQLLTLASTLSGISVAKLTEWRDTAAQPGTCPYEIVDYRKSTNPYKERYGDTWEEEISKTVFMKQHMCIRELVQKIHDRSKEAFQGTVHESDWFFYHDALSQLTAKSTVDWMKQEGYYQRWLIPQLGLNDGTRYACRPVGNRPEWMPLDNSLNNDIQSSLSLHCAITAHLDDKDERKFSLATPKTIVSGINRIYGNEHGNVPSST